MVAILSETNAESPSTGGSGSMGTVGAAAELGEERRSKYGLYIVLEGLALVGLLYLATLFVFVFLSSGMVIPYLI